MLRFDELHTFAQELAAGVALKCGFPNPHAVKSIDYEAFDSDALSLVAIYGNSCVTREGTIPGYLIREVIDRVKKVKTVKEGDALISFLDFVEMELEFQLGPNDHRSKPSMWTETPMKALEAKKPLVQGPNGEKILYPVMVPTHSVMMENLGDQLKLQIAKLISQGVTPQKILNSLPEHSKPSAQKIIDESSKLTASDIQEMKRKLNRNKFG